MIASNAAESCASFWFSSAIFSLNFRGFAMMARGTSFSRTLAEPGAPTTTATTTTDRPTTTTTTTLPTKQQHPIATLVGASFSLTQFPFFFYSHSVVLPRRFHSRNLARTIIRDTRKPLRASSRWHWLTLIRKIMRRSAPRASRRRGRLCEPIGRDCTPRCGRIRKGESPSKF